MAIGLINKRANGFNDATLAVPRIEESFGDVHDMILPKDILVP